MPHADVRPVHSDFRMVERSPQGTIDGADALARVGAVLRSSWMLPTDTFVTADLPLLVTRLSLPSADDRA